MPEAASRSYHRGAHRHVKWRRPATRAQRARWPEVLRNTEYELVQALERRQGQLWSRISREAIVAGYAWTNTDGAKGPPRCAQHRVRTLRSDGAESLLAMLVALLYSTDLRTGFVGRPRKGGGPWHRYTLEDLALFAYQAKDEGSVRKARRALDVLINLGFAHPTIQVNRYDEETHVVRGEPAVRRLNWELLCKLANTTWYLNKAQEHAAAKARAAREKARKQESRSKANVTPTFALEDAYADAVAYAEKLFDDTLDQVERFPADTGDPPSS